MKKVYIILIALFVVNGAMAQWFPQNSGTTKNLNSVCFTDANTGYACGDSGVILKTADGGSNWMQQNWGTPYYLSSVHFPKADTGYIEGDCDVSLKTSNGGLIWINLEIYICMPMMGEGVPLTTSVYFTDVSTGFRVSDVCNNRRPPQCQRLIEKTTDGGIFWFPIYYETDSYPLRFSSVFFSDIDRGYVVGTYGTILKTIDGGANWSNQNSGTTNGLCSIYYTDESTGYTVGGEGTILKTTDGGINWITQNSGTTVELYSVFFSDENLGYTVGNGGIILKTTDGGTNWITEYSGTTSSLHSVYFPSIDTGYIVGDSGIILKTTNGGYPVGMNDLSSKSSTLKTYPNPTSTEVTIESPTKGQLSILNLCGKQLINRQITEPKTVIDISNLPSGVYFGRATGEKMVQVGKFVKQ